MQTFQELEHKLLNEHAERLHQWSKTLLTLAAGILGLWAGLHANLPTSPGAWAWLTKAVWALMVLSLAFGVWHEWSAVMEPWRALTRARKIQERALQTPGREPGSAVELRRRPERLQRIALHLQTAAFLLSFVALTAIVQLR